MTENPLGYEKIPKLLKNFAVPSIVASLVGSICQYSKGLYQTFLRVSSINRFNRHLHLNKKCTCSKLSKCRNQFVSYLLFHRFTS